MYIAVVSAHRQSCLFYFLVTKLVRVEFDDQFEISTTCLSDDFK